MTLKWSLVSATSSSIHCYIGICQRWIVLDTIFQNGSCLLVCLNKTPLLFPQIFCFQAKCATITLATEVKTFTKKA